MKDEASVKTLTTSESQQQAAETKPTKDGTKLKVEVSKKKKAITSTPNKRKEKKRPQSG